MKRYLSIYTRLFLILFVISFAKNAMAQGTVSFAPIAFEVTGADGGNIDATEGASKVVDGNVNTKWCRGGTSSYKRIEYLENTGNVKTYFQTNYRPVANTVIEIKYQTRSDALNDNQWRSLFAARTTADNGFSFYVNNRTSEKKYGYFVGGYKNDFCGTVDDEVHTAICSLGGLKIDGTDVVTTGRTEYNASNRNLAIFGNPGIDESFKGKIYYVKVYEGDRLVKYYVPVKDGDSYAFFDLMHGDKVEKTGDGTFTAGAEGVSATQHYVTFLASDAVPCSVEGFSLTTGGDTQTYTGRNPVSCTLYGGADGKSWEPIEHFDALDMPESNNTTKYFKLSKTSKKYKYYQMMFTSLKSGGMIQLSEITLTPCMWAAHSNHNMWRKADEANSTWGAPDNRVKGTHTAGSDIYDIQITGATATQWQNQFGITATDVHVSKSGKYNFYCVMEADKAMNDVTVKLQANGTDDDSNNNYLVNERAIIDLVKPNTTYILKANNVQLSKQDVADPANGMKLIFDFAGVPNSHVRISHIYMEPAFAPDWDYNDPRNAWKEVDRKSTSYTGHQPKVSNFEHQYDTKVWEFDINAATAAQWESWVQIHSGYPVKHSSNYCFYVAVMADKNVTNATIKLEQKGNGSNSVFSQSGINLQAGVPYYFKKDFATPNADFDDLSFVMDFAGAQANTHVIVSDIYLAEQENWDYNSADNKWATATTQNGDSWNVGTPTYDAGTKEWHATIANDYNADWAAGIKIKSNLPVSTDKVYDCYATIIVDKDVEGACVKVESSAAGGGENYIFETGHVLNLKAYTPYIFKIADQTPNVNFDNAQLTVSFHTAQAGTKVTIKDIYLSEDKLRAITDGTKVILHARAADGTDLGYLDRNFQPGPDGVPYMLEKDGGNTYLRNQEGRLSYYLFADVFRNGSNVFYQRDDLAHVFGLAQLQYYNNSTTDEKRKYPQFKAMTAENDVAWNTMGGTWLHNADQNISGSWWNYANRYCNIRFYESGKVRFVLKDAQLQDNSRPMDPTNSGRTLLSEFMGKGTNWSDPFYLTVAKGYPHNNTETQSQVIYPTTDRTKAITLSFETPVTEFIPYVGDTYAGIVGTDIPKDLLYNGAAFKSHADDGRILPETGPIQRTHEYEREVWVFPGVDYELLPYSDFKTAGQYEESYVRWYDYATGVKSDHLVPVERDVVDIPDGLFGGKELTGNRQNGTSMIYHAGLETTNNIWLASPAMTHSYTPGHVTYDDKVYQMSNVTSAEVKKWDGSGDKTQDASWLADGTATKTADKITVNFTGTTDETKRIFINPGYDGYENSVDYRLHIKVKASRNMTGVELYPLEKTYTIGGVTSPGFEKSPVTFNLVAGVEKELTFDFSEGINARGSRIWLDNITAQAGDQLEIYDVYILKGTPPTAQPLKIEQKNNSYKFSFAETDGRWRAMVMFDKVYLNVNNYSDYTFKFKINSSSALVRTTHKTNELDNGGIFVKLEDCTNPGNFLFAGIVEISESEKGHEVEKVITIPRSGTTINIDGTDYPKEVSEGVSASILQPGGIQECKVIFDFGSNPATDVEINNIVLMDHTETTNAELLDIIAMDASCSFTTADNVEFSGVKQTITEPNVHFRNVFVVKNAKVRADIMSNKSKNETQYDAEGYLVSMGYVESHKEKLMAPTGTPFQYRLPSPERWDFDSHNTYTTEFWYKKDNTGNVSDDYAPVYHYLIETWKKDGSGIYQKLGSTINFKDGGEYYGGKPANIDNLAMLYKSVNYVDRVFYIKNPEVGDYQIKFYAIENSLESTGAGAARAKPIYYYGESQIDANRMLLMEYDLTVLPLEEGNMLLWDDLYDDATYTARGEKNPYAHQRPAKMEDLYGQPTTVVNFDELDPSRLTLDANGDGYYKWPRKWEESSYAFGYEKRHDYNMYVVANNAKVTPYHEAIEKDGNGTKEFHDILYKETGGAKKGFFYYTNAAGDPGRMTVLNIGEDFCPTSTVFVSAWVMEFSKVGETANVVFSFKGVDANGTETTLNSFVTGYVTGGDNKLSNGNNPDNRGKWHHVYYSFHPDNIGNKKFDHFIISVENNCVSSAGADYAIDDIRAFVCKPAVYARQRVPVCNGDKTTKLILTADYDQLKQAFTFEEDDHDVRFYYCFVDQDKYNEGIKDIEEYSDPTDRNNCRLTAFNNALVLNAYGPDHATYGILKFDGTFASNADYDLNPDDVVIPTDPSTPLGTILNVARKYTDPDTGKRMLVFPSFANDHDMNVGKSYIVAMVEPTVSDPTADDFKIDEACSSTTSFTVITSGLVKIDGELASDQNDASVCANQIPEIKIDMSGIGNLGTIQTTENAYFDWFKGPKTGSQYYKKAPDACTENQGSCSPLFSWDTDNDGNVIITISAGEGTDGQTKFRNTGMNGTFSLNGNAADFNTYFNKGKKDDYTYVLTLKNPANKPATGAKISYTGEIECMSSLHDNDWSKYSFSGYTYGAEAEENYDYASYGGVLLDDALAKFRSQYADADETDFNDCTTNGTYLQTHRDCIKHFLDEGKITLYKNTEFLSTYDEYQKVTDPDEQRKFYLTALPINPTPDKPDLKYCLEPFEIVLKLSTRTPRMKNGDDSGRIPYPADMRDVPLRIGLKQLNRVRMADLNDEHPANFLYMPLREVTPATTGVTSLIQKSQDDYVYLVASTDPNVAAGESGAVEVTGYTTSDIKVIGKVSIIKALPGKGLGNVCHLNFLSGFKFREGYDYTIKFKFEENYTGVVGDHSDVCPGDVVCTIKVVPEYQMWTGAEDSNWNNDKNWKRVSSDELLTEIAGSTIDELWNNASVTCESYLAPNWAVDANSTANYNTSTGVLSVHIAGGAKGRWQGQLQLTQDVARETTKEYTFSCDILSTKDINNMCFQFNKDQAPIIEPISITANTPYHFVVEHCVPITSSNGVMIFDTGATEDDIDLTFSNFSITHKTPGSNEYYTDGVENDNLNSFVPADFTKVIIPADAERPPKLHNLRRGTPSENPDEASTNLTIVRFAGNSQDCNYIKDMTAPTAIGEATDRIGFHMSSIDMDDNTDGSDDNVACRSWYDHTCKYIHFDAGAQMLSQQYLHYEKAWADFEMEPNKWTTISSPLINVVSGDLYLPTATARQDTPLFEDITFDPALHDRFHPAVFQRTWNAANAKVMHLDGSVTSSMVDLDWSQVYNDGNVNYTAGVGFAIKPDVSMMAVKPAKVKFRLPKADTNYHYWNPNHQNGNVHDENVPAGMLDDGGNRAHQLADLSNVYAQSVVQNGQKTTKYYLIGNPMMCYLNMKEFFDKNTNLDRKYWIVTGQGQQYAEMDDKTAGYVGTVDNTYVAPFQSFFVKLKDDYTSQPGDAPGTFKPDFTSDMMVARHYMKSDNGEYEWFEEVTDQDQYERDDNGNIIEPGRNPDGSPSEEESDKGNGGSNEVDDYVNPINGTPAKPYLLNITATDGNNNTSSVILTDGVERQTSGVEALFDSNLRMSGYPMLYTTKNHEAMSLTQILPGDTIPVALSNVRGEVTLKIKGADTFETPLYLIDATTGETVPLTNDVVLTQEENGVKYYIAAEPTEIEEVPASGLPQIITEGNTLIVKAPADAEIDYIRIYKIDGITVATDEHVGDTFTITLPHNVYIIDIVCNGHRQTVKISM